MRGLGDYEGSIYPLNVGCNCIHDRLATINITGDTNGKRTRQHEREILDIVEKRTKRVTSKCGRIYRF